MKKVNYIEILINKQFEIAGYDLNEVNYNKLIETKDNDWYSRYTTTPEKQSEFIEWLKPYVKKNIKIINLEKEVSMFMLMYGLRVKE